MYKFQLSKYFMKIYTMSLFLLLVIVVMHFSEHALRNVIPFELFQVTVGGKCGFIDDKGRLLFTLPDNVYQTGKFQEGMAVFFVATPDGIGKVGYIDSTGKVVIQPGFTRGERFSEGVAAVQIDNSAGYVNYQGEIVIKLKSWSPLSKMRLSEGLAAVESLVDTKSGPAHRTGYIDKRGEFVIQPQFVQAFPFKEGRAIISDKDSSTRARYGFIDKSGETVIPIQYVRVSDFSEGLAMVMVEQNAGNKIGYIDKNGNYIIKPIFDDIYILPMEEAFIYEASSGTEGLFSEGLASVKMNGKWGYIDRTGQFVIRPQFAHAGIFKEGLAPAAIKNGRRPKYGFIDRTGRFVISPQFDGVREFDNGLASVFVFNSRGEFDKAGYIDKSGKYIWKPTK